MAQNQIIPCPTVVIGGSAGSLDVLLQVLPHLSPQLPLAVVIVLHRKPTDDTILEELIATKSALFVKEVEDKVPLQPGHIFIAPADYHLLFEKTGLLSLDLSEKINYSRPSIDVSFESAAESLGSSLCCILLSGANADGTIGLATVKRLGGTTAVQAPENAGMPFMPDSAITHSDPDFILKNSEIARFINNFKP